MPKYNRSTEPQSREDRLRDSDESVLDFMPFDNNGRWHFSLLTLSRLVELGGFASLELVVCDVPGRARQIRSAGATDRTHAMVPKVKAASV